MKKILLTIAAAAFLSGTVFAVDYTTINITGATAFRRAMNEAILALMQANPADFVGYGFSNGSAAAYYDADRTIFKGKITGVGDVIVRTSQRGSVEGIQDVTQQNDVSFIPAGSTLTTSPSTAITATEPGKANLTWSDVFQGSTAFTSPGLTDTKTSTDKFPGVVSFVFAANEFACNKALAASQTANTKINTTYSMTNQLARLALQNGYIALSALTGNSTHSTKTLFLTGRYPGSGTRVTELANVGYTLSDPVIQYKPLKGTSGNYTVVTSNADTITALQVWPTTGDPATTGDDPTPGNGGFFSSGGLRQVLGASFASGAGSVAILDADGTELYTDDGDNLGLITWVGKSDINNSAANGAILMPYVGVSATDGGTSMTDTTSKSGTYTAWGYEHLLQRGTVTIESSLAQKIADNLTTAVNSAGFKDDAAMTVKRADDGALVQPK